MRSTSAALMILLAGCIVAPKNRDGLKCDAEHPCGPGRSCVLGVCGELRPDAGGALDSGQPPDAGECWSPCPLQGGACGNATYRCGESPDTCNYGPQFQFNEQNCDGIDNDCDGIVDDVTGCLWSFAGSEPYGFKDGPALSARFRALAGIAIAPNQDVYVVDQGNHALRKIDAQGTVSTVVGNGRCGHTDGPVEKAQLCAPSDVAIARNGDVYVSQAHSIRRVSNGVVSTLAGTAASGLVDGLGAAARFYTPMQMTVLGNGDLLVADSANHRIRRITPLGVVTTEAGSSVGDAEGTRLTLQLRTPMGVTASPDGTLYIVEYGGHRIRRVPANGISTVFAGTTFGYADGAPSTARFYYPQRISDGSNGIFYVSDYSNSAIRAVPLDGGLVSTIVRSTTRGYADGPSATSESFNLVAVAASGSRVVFTDRNSNVRMVDLNAHATTTIAGPPPSRQSADGPIDAGSMRYLLDIVRTPDGGIIFAQGERQPLRMWNGSGIKTILELGQDTEGPLFGATAVAANALAYSDDDRLYFMNSTCKLRMIDFRNQTVRAVTGNGCLTTSLENGILGAVRLGNIRRMSFYNVGNQPTLYLTQTQGVIRTVNLATNMVSTWAGTLYPSGIYPAPDGPPGTGAVSTYCTEVISDNAGGGYIGDYDRIRFISPSGTISTLSTPGSTIVNLARSKDRIFILSTGGVSSFNVNAPTAITKDFMAPFGSHDGTNTLAGFFDLSASGIEVTEQEVIVSDYFRLRRIWR